MKIPVMNFDTGDEICASTTISFLKSNKLSSYCKPDGERTLSFTTSTSSSLEGYISYLFVKKFSSSQIKRILHYFNRIIKSYSSYHNFLRYIIINDILEIISYPYVIFS